MEAMPFSVRADRHLLGWKSSYFLGQECKLPSVSQRPPLQLRQRHMHTHSGLCTASLIRRSPTGWLSQDPKAPLPFRLKRYGARFCFRIIAQAGRSKPRNPQPIRPRRRRKVRLPTGEQPDPAGNIRRRKTSNRQEREPYVRHPDDYYKFGPFGPYNYKARVAGTMIPVTSFEQDFVAMWSTIKDLEHYEQVDIENACIRYHNRVRLFDQRIGLKYFYVFVRSPYYYGPEPPWRQWTLVSEIAVETGEELDKETLIDRLNNSMRNRITQHTAWFRPDLVHVKPKRRRYQVRFEPELEFLGELKKMLVTSAGEPDEADSYYGVFCQTLGLDVNASHEDITSKFETASEEIKLACLEHLLSNHPIKLLYPIPYPSRSMWTSQQAAGKSSATNPGEISMQKDNVDEEDGFNGDDDDDDGYSEGELDEVKETEFEDWDDLDDDEIEARLSREASDLTDKEPEVVDPNDLEKDAIDSDDDEGEGYVADQHASLSGGTSMLKAAARPYTYVNFIREMVMLREINLERKRRRSLGRRVLQ